MKSILIVEDEKNIQDMISIYLKSNGYKVSQAYDYIEAWEILNEEINFDLILLDWMIPNGSGLKLLEFIRQNVKLKQIPVIMVSAKTDVDDRIQGLNKGVDDYLTKPFSLKELTARIEANLRRWSSHSENIESNNPAIVEYDDIKIDTIAHRVFIKGEDIPIRRIEFKLLTFLASHPERVFNRAQLLDNVWGVNTYIDERTVDVSIGRLKKILKDTGHEKLLQTIRGEGYRFSKIY